MIKRGDINDGILHFEGIEQELEIPCRKCGTDCGFFGKPYPGNEIIQVVSDFQWPVKIDICGITLEFRELFIDGKPVIFDKKRYI